MMLKKWILISFLNFLIAGLMGLVLRLQFVAPLECINYPFLLHGHSHIAMLGWVYLALFALIYHFFIPKEESIRFAFNRLFWITEIAVIGMMLTFPWQGYAVFSIVFSTLHIFCSYYFVFLVFKHQKIEILSERYLLKTALVFMFLSTLGVWCLGPAVGLMGKASAFYQIAIQFFLHFQFNGWFVIAVLALLFRQMKLEPGKKEFCSFYKWLIIGTVLTLALPVSWFLAHPVFTWINGIGSIAQLIAFWKLAQLMQPKFSDFFCQLRKIEKITFGFALLSLGLKILIQLIVLVPEMATISHQIRNFVIGFIHLTMLGIVTGALFGSFLHEKLICGEKQLLNWGIKIFILGFLLTEFLLFTQGLYQFLNLGAMPMYFENLLLSSIWLPVGILIIIISIFKHKETQLS